MIKGFRSIAAHFSAALAIPVFLISGGATAAVAADDSGECRLAYPAGTHTLTIQSGGIVRTAIIHVPRSYAGMKRIPMVLTLHGSQANAEIQMAISEMAAAAEKHSFIAVAPQGILAAPPGFRWNVPGVTLPAGQPPDDEAFLSDTIDAVKSVVCVDAKRVYGTGYSGGGRMISQYACDHPERMAAIAPVVGLRAGYPISGQDYPDPATCTPGRPVPVLAFAGTADMVNPYAGGGAPYWQYGALAALQRWSELNDCKQDLQTTAVTEHASLLAYSACRQNAVVQMYVAEGAGHTWPGSEYSVELYEGALGEVTFEIEATDLMWRFFTLHPLPGAPK
jgi:polyhydroxybutyrate depolymerase